MNGEASVAAYLMQRWFEEDDDGFNLVIIDERRKRLEHQMSDRLRAELPIRIDEHGIKYYSFEILDKAWAEVVAASS